MRDPITEAVAESLWRLDWADPENPRYPWVEEDKPRQDRMRWRAEQLLKTARPMLFEIEAKRCAEIAASYGPSRPITADKPSSLIKGRWEGEQAASANIAAMILRQLP